MRFSRKHKVKRLTPRQRKRSSQLFTCRYCGDVIRENEARQILPGDRSCACPACLEQLSMQFECALVEGALHG